MNAWRSPIALITAAAILGGLIIIAVVSIPGRGSPSPSGAVSVIPPAFTTPTDRAAGRALGAAGLPTLEVWSDNQCPACAFYWREVNPRVVSDYVNAGRIRVVHRDFAFIGPESTASAIASRCADAQGRFWPYHDYVIANQAGENTGRFSSERLAAIASAVGLDPAAYGACIADPAVAAALAAETDDASSVPVQATPTLVLVGAGGRVIPGAPTFESLAPQIDAWLAAAHMVRGGPPAR